MKLRGVYQAAMPQEGRMSITSFDRTTMRALGREIEDAVAAVAAKHGISLKYAGGTFDANNFTMKIAGATIAQNGDVITKAHADFEKYAPIFGLAPTDLGRQFRTPAGKEYRISGLKPASSKFPVLATQVGTGKTFKFPAGAVVSMLKAGSV
jgi:hypothetical protein